MRWLALICLLAFAACGPVLLRGDRQTPQAGAAATMDHRDSGTGGTSAANSAGAAASTTNPPVQVAVPQVLIAVRATDCGRCFQLLATGTGGAPPYQFEWDDGTHDSQRHVCLDHGPIAVAVIAQDANAANSTVTITRLESDVDAGCSLPPPSTPTKKLCVMNPSFEGMPAVNIGVPGSFDAAPWSLCSSSGAANTPDIANDTFAQLVGQASPKPIDGNTFLAMAEGEQVSQTLCDTVQVGATTGLTLDLARVTASAAAASPEALTLEIWGGLASDCTQRQLLWKSGPLDFGWKRLCAKLKPTDVMDQITLRATSNMPPSASTYLLVDNLVPSTDCP